MTQSHYVYMLASKPRGAIYVDSTSDLIGTVEEHKANLVDGLTSLYAIHLLIHYERFDKSGPALLRQRELKRMQRYQKLALIERVNPGWRDLYEDLVHETARSMAAMA